MPKVDTTEHSDLFLRAEPLIHELRSGIGVLMHVSSSQHELEPGELAFLTDKLHETVEKLRSVWENEEKRREPENHEPDAEQ